MLVARNKERRLLESALEADESQFIAVFGRRRVGKTYLIREAYQGNFTFQHIGYANTGTKGQLFDMNGLKAINDNQGHIVGDDAHTTLALCFTKALRTGESGYRIGGDEFAIVGRRISQSEMLELAKRIEGSVEKTEYSCSIGYSYNDGGEKTVGQMLKEADEMMYSNKARYYAEYGKDRRAASI